MFLRILIVLLLPGAALAQASGAGIARFPFVGGPSVFAYVFCDEYPPGQEVCLEVYATSDLPGAKQVFLGRAKKVVGAAGKVRVTIITAPLPETQSEWYIKYWYSPKNGSVNTPLDFTARRHPRVKK